MKTFTKKLIAVIMAVTSIFTVAASTSVTAYAASYSAYNQISSSKPLKTYILTTKNIACFTTKKLTTRGTATAGKSSTAYIAPTDDVYVVTVYSDTNSAKVTYPVGKKRYTAYISLGEITSNNSNHEKTTASGKVMTYKRTNTNTGSSTMYISKGETVYRIATSGSYVQVMYPCTGGYRLAWVTKSDYNTYLSGGGSTQSNNTTYQASFTYPMKNYSTKYTQWGVKVSYKSAPRNYHAGVDFISSSDKNVYSICSGTVAAVGWNNSNGNYVVIKHIISGKTVYSFYAHLKSYCVSKGTSVGAGTKVGIVGATGSSSNGITHLHFAIVNTLWSGSYYGYTTAISGNKVTYKGVTYYNPYYVIKYGKLPS